MLLNQNYELAEFELKDAEALFRLSRIAVQLRSGGDHEPAR